MKFKKAFAWILAVAMVITLMPSMAFASTTNSVASVPTVAADGKISTPIDLTLRVDDVAGWQANENQKIKLTLENGTWDREPNSADSANRVIINNDSTATPAIVNILEVGAGGPSGVTSSAITAVNFTSASENSLEFNFTADQLSKDDYITLQIPANAVKAGAEAGPLNIAIDGLDSKVTSRTLTVANVGTSNTVSTVTGTVKTLPRKTVAASDLGTAIEIRETAVNSLKAGTFQSLRLTAPKGVSFNNISSWEFSGDLVTGTGPNGKIVGGTDIHDAGSNGNDRVMNLYFNVANDTNSVRNVLVIKPSITVSRDAAEGDIALQLVGGVVANSAPTSLPTSDATNDNKISDASDLVIAKYGNEAIEVSTVENIPTFISGYTKDTKGKSFTFKVTLKENMQKALAAGRYVDFELPEEVQICGNIKAKIGSGGNESVNASFIEVGDRSGNGEDPTKDMSTFSFIVPPLQAGGSMAVNNSSNWSDTKANTITFEVPVTVQADFTGDITCKVSGAKAGVEETSLVVAKAESPITVTTQTTEVRNGVQTQAVSDITITENYPGYLDDENNKNNVILRMYTLGLGTNEMVFEDYESITVTDGDLELEKPNKTGGSITIPIKNSSTKASTIEIKGAVVALNRTLPEGPYALQVYGSALVQNDAYNDNGFAAPGNNQNATRNGDVCAAKVADYVKIVTPADPSTMENKINAVFVLRQDTFTNNGETVQMDTAPYLDANNRTQMPIRYAAMACGVDESDISWDQASQTATINGKNVVLRITIGSNIMQTSNGNITMDTAAVSSNGRIFVPIRYIANALGAEVGWDYDTKTITLTN